MTSPTPPPDNAYTSSRLETIEAKLAFAEDLLETLNAIVARQTEQIEVLGREIVRLRDRLERSGTGSDTGMEMGDERPPHY